MTQTNISNYQQQPVIAGHVAGTNWGQSFVAEEIFLPTNTYGELFSYQTWDNSGLVGIGQSAKRGLRSKTKYVEPPQAGVVTKSLDEYALETSIDYREIKAAQVRDQLRSAASENGLSSVDELRLGMAMNVDLKIQIEKEKDAATLLFDKTNYLAALRYTGAGGESAKIDFAATGIINNFQTVARLIAKTCGFMPDTLVLAYSMWQKLFNNSDIVARITGGSNNLNPAIVNNKLIADLLGLQKVVICSGVTQAPAVAPTSATGGTGTATDIWTTDTAALIYTGQGTTPSLASPAFCKMFYMDVPETGVRKDVRTWLSDNGKVESLEVTEFSMPAITFGSAGAYFIA